MHVNCHTRPLLSLLQLPALRPSWWWTLPANQTTSRCRGRPRRAPSLTWPWLKTQRVTGGPVTPAAPPVRSPVCPADSSTTSTLLVLMLIALERRVTLKWSVQVCISHIWLVCGYYYLCGLWLLLLNFILAGWFIFKMSDVAVIFFNHTWAAHEKWA